MVSSSPRSRACRRHGIPFDETEAQAFYDAVPRFDYERHVHTLIGERAWPNSTVDISELRLVIDYQRQNGAERTLTLSRSQCVGKFPNCIFLLGDHQRLYIHAPNSLSRAGISRQLINFALNGPEIAIAEIGQRIRRVGRV